MPEKTADVSLLVAREATVAKLSTHLCRIAVELSEAEFLQLLNDMTRARLAANGLRPGAVQH
jgi:hypothetical protein